MLKPGSVPARALDHCITSTRLLISTGILHEYRAVLGRPRLVAKIDLCWRNLILTAVEQAAAMLEPDLSVSDCRDAKDNKYLELALAGAADVIVSSDRDLLELDPWRGIRIITPAQFLALVPPLPSHP